MRRTPPKEKGEPLQGYVQFEMECDLCNMKTKLKQLKESIC
jgi:hypothetical protein